MRSFSKNSFGFNKISPGVFIGVLIVLIIVFLIINPFKSSLTAESYVAGWSSSGTPKNKDTWDKNQRYDTADACAAYALQQGNVGYTWRNGSHPRTEGKKTCVTLKEVKPNELTKPMLDTATHTTGCSIQFRKWPNCGTSEDVKNLGTTMINYNIAKTALDLVKSILQNNNSIGIRETAMNNAQQKYELALYSSNSASGRLFWTDPEREPELYAERMKTAGDTAKVTADALKLLNETKQSYKDANTAFGNLKKTLNYDGKQKNFDNARIALYGV